jgi:hypothetical protein
MFNMQHVPRLLSLPKGYKRKETKMSSLNKDHETKFNASCIQNGPTLFLKLALYFMLPIMIKGGKSMIIQT